MEKTSYDFLIKGRLVAEAYGMLLLHSAKSNQNPRQKKLLPVKQFFD